MGVVDGLYLHLDPAESDACDGCGEVVVAGLSVVNAVSRSRCCCLVLVLPARSGRLSLTL
jgi:hypothetical protein